MSEGYSSSDDEAPSDISGKIIGPMTTKDFLAKFAPSEAFVSVNPPSTVILDQIKDSSKETDMYESFIGAFKGYVSPGARFADSHASPLSQWDEKIIAPSVVLLDNALDTTWLEHYPGVGSTAFKVRPIESVGIMLKFKLDGETSDPFSDEDDISFEIKPKDSKDPRKQTLDQIFTYASVHLANQFRSHVFSVLVFREYARILRWDRAGVVVTKKISFKSENAQLLAEFFCRYASATPAERGVDPYTERIDISSPELTTEVKKQLDGTSKKSFYKFRFPASSGDDKFYIVAAPQFMVRGSSIVGGRSTRSFKAYDVQTGKYVLLKDTWRLLGYSLVPEHERYATLYEAGVHHIPTVSTYHDFTSQGTKTSLDLLPGAKRGNSPEKFRKFQHYRLVLEEYATPLEEFADVKQLLTVFRDAIQAHSEAYEKAHILHRDVSVGNIMIGPDGRGLLIDWEFSKSTSDTTSLPVRMGTWEFMACRFVGQSNKDIPFPVHDRDDDLESFWHVLHWVALRNCETLADSNTIYEAQYTLEHAYKLSLGPWRATPYKRMVMLIPPQGIFSSPPLQKVINDFRECIVVRYITNFEPLTAERFSWIRKIWKKMKDTDVPISSKTQSFFEKEPGSPDNPLGYLGVMRRIIVINEPGWEVSIFDRVLNPSGSLTVDWKEHRRGLEFCARSSSNKRKPDSQHTTGVPSGSNFDGGGNVRNKKARKDPELREGY